MTAIRSRDDWRGRKATANHLWSNGCVLFKACSLPQVGFHMLLDGLHVQPKAQKIIKLRYRRFYCHVITVTAPAFANSLLASYSPIMAEPLKHWVQTTIIVPFSLAFFKIFSKAPLFSGILQRRRLQ